MIGNPPSGVKDTGSIHHQETKIPCAAGQLSPYATTGEAHEPAMEPTCCRVHGLQQKHAQLEKAMCHNEELAQPKLKKKLGCLYLFK